MDGFLLIDKVIGSSSYDVVRGVRKKFQMKRVGHSGTLDPLATGLMLLALGNATKFLEFHIHKDKEYIAEITFGSVSETYDKEGPITTCDFQGEISLEILKKHLKKFLGEIEQVPPKYSALKVNGKKLCNLVREGKEVNVEDKKRKITVHDIKIISYSWPKLVLKIFSGSGTYIRSIAHDLGKELGCGGYLSALRRSKIDIFSLNDAKKIENVEPSCVLLMNVGLTFPVVKVTEEILKRLQFGQRVSLSDISKNQLLRDGFYQVFVENEFFGVSVVEKGVMKAYKVLQ